MNHFYYVDGDSTTNQQRCNHRHWSEAKVRQQYLDNDRSVSAPDVNSPTAGFFQGWLLSVLLTLGALSDPVLIYTVK